MSKLDAATTRYNLLLSAICASSAAVSAPMPLSDAPLFLLEGVPPNVVLTTDDSTSMARAFLPDGIERVGSSLSVNTLRLKSSDFNHVHYDPGITYTPPAYVTSTQRFPDADFRDLCLNAFAYYDPAAGGIDACPVTCRLDLQTDYRSPFNEFWSLESISGTTSFCAWESADSGQDPLLPSECSIETFDSSGNLISSKPNPVPPAGINCEASAFYYRYEPANPANAECDGTLEDDDCYSRYDVGSAEDVDLTRTLQSEVTDLIDSAWTRQNFANWFQYYRNRLLAAKSAVSVAMATLDSRTRVGYQGLYSAALGDGPDVALHGVERFDGASRLRFFEWLGDLDAEKPKPLHESSIRVGEYFSGAQVAATTSYPYNADPADSGSDVYQCQRNYHVLFTDGSWDIPYLSPLPPAASENWDGTAYIPPDPEPPADPYPVHYGDPAAPFMDLNVGGLADVAHYYWSRDLCTESECPNTLQSLIRSRRDLDGDGEVTDEELYLNPRNNPATWQHMVTYTAGLGVTGNIPYNPDDPFPDLLFECDNVWSKADPESCSGDDPFDVTASVVNYSGAAAIDDLWHAAVNGRGQYFSARDTQQLLEGFGDILGDITTADGIGSAAAAAVHTGSLQSSTRVYQVLFDSTDWSGDVKAFNISLGASDERPGCASVPRGELCSHNPAWTAAAPLDATAERDERSIVTFNGNNGIAFDWNQLTAAQQAALQRGDSEADGEARLEYLRGSRVGEGAVFRERSSVLGDIVNSGPLLVRPPNRFYTLDSYRDFVRNNSDRPDMLYVGANDGMLHAFLSDSGEEIFAYVPALVFDGLAELTDLDYVHRFYVDGPLNAGDVLIDGRWRSVLVGALGKGGQGLFALDITNPVPASETEAASMPLWEFSDRVDRDLGYLYGRPAIVQIASGLSCSANDATIPCPTKWVVILGNGYNNTCDDDTHPGECRYHEEPQAHCTDGDDDTRCTISQSGSAVLYILDVADGKPILGGKLDTRAGTRDAPNGLAAPTVVDANADLIADYAYAGDLLGNLWKFDLTDLAQPPRRLFTAQDASGVGQPITAPVEVMRHPTGFGALVLFGTGKYLGADDVGDAQTQTFYGIWDRGSPLSDAKTLRDNNQLLAQTFITDDAQEVSNADGRVVSEARLTSDRAIDWSTQEGWYIDLQDKERVVTKPELRDGRVVFVSLVPSGDPCIPGGYSWVNALSAKDGSRLGLSPFDFDRDGVFGVSDLITVTLDGNETAVTGSSIRLVLGGASSGVYSAPASLVLEGGATMSYVTTSEGALITLRESSALQWRVWSETR